MLFVRKTLGCHNIKLSKSDQMYVAPVVNLRPINIGVVLFIL